MNVELGCSIGSSQLDVLEPVALTIVSLIFIVSATVFFFRTDCCGCLIAAGGAAKSPRAASLRCGGCCGGSGTKKEGEMAARIASLESMELAYKWNTDMFVTRSKIQREIIALKKLVGGSEAAPLEHVEPEEEEDALAAGAAAGGGGGGGGAEDGGGRCAQLRSLVKSGSGVASLVGIDLSSLVVKAVLNAASLAVVIVPCVWWWGRPMLRFPSQWLTMSLRTSSSGNSTAAAAASSGIFARFMAGPDVPLGYLSVTTWASICWSACWSAVQLCEPGKKTKKKVMMMTPLPQQQNGGGGRRAAAAEAAAPVAAHDAPLLVDEVD